MCEPRGEGLTCNRELGLIGLCGTSGSIREAIKLLRKNQLGDEAKIGGCPIAREYLLKRASQKWSGKKVTFVTSTDGKQLKCVHEGKSETVNSGSVYSKT